MLDQANRAVRAIVNLPQPVVAVVQGPAAGVGVSLALACDVVIASEKAFFLLAFTKIGLMPDGGASALVAAAIGRTRAMRMALLAERFSASEALSAGSGQRRAPRRRSRRRGRQGHRDAVSGPAVACARPSRPSTRATLTELDAALARETRRPAGAARLQRPPRGHQGVPGAARAATFTDT